MARKKAVPAKMEPPAKKKMGAPIKYRPEFCEKIVRFFSVEPWELKERQFVRKDGSEGTQFVREPNRLPTFHKFAESIGVNEDSVVNWASARDEKGELRYPDFSAAYQKAKTLQKYFLIENGMTGLYNAPFTIFVAKNITDMRDHYEVEQTERPKRVVLDT